MTDVTERRTRRDLLTAAMAGAVAAAAGALGRPAPTRAANGDNAVLGTTNQATAVTIIRNPGGDALRGSSQTGTAVSGTSRDGTAVKGFTHQGTGTDSFSEFGVGIVGSTDFGVGIRADGGSYGGRALEVNGHVTFGWSGVAIIPAGETKVVMDVGHGEDPHVYPESFVLLSPKDDLGARGLWYTTSPNLGRFAIHISRARSSPTRVAWLLAERPSVTLAEAGAGHARAADEIAATARTRQAAAR